MMCYSILTSREYFSALQRLNQLVLKSFAVLSDRLTEHQTLQTEIRYKILRRQPTCMTFVDVGQHSCKRLNVNKLFDSCR